jgi:putative ABC transport system permease protein
MFRLYTKIAWRNLVRNRVYSVINIVGLALGITAFLLILEYVSFEKSYNQFHKALNSTYRLVNEDTKGGTWAQVEPGWAAKAKQSFPEIKAYCRFEEGVSQGIVKADGDNAVPFRENKTGYADSNFFSFFSFPLVKGRASDFGDPNTVFLSVNAAQKYFGSKDPLDRSISLYNQFGEAKYAVKGVYNIPENSDIQYDMVFSLETMGGQVKSSGNSWAALDNVS